MNGGESDSSVSDLLTFASTASIQLGQAVPPLPASEQCSLVQHQSVASIDEGESCDEIDDPEHRSRFYPISDNTCQPPFSVVRKAVTRVWKGIASRLTSAQTTHFSFRAHRDRSSLLPRKDAVRKKLNDAVSNTSDVHIDLHDVFEQLQHLEDEAAAEIKSKGNSPLPNRGNRDRRAKADAGNRGKSKRIRLSTLLNKELEEVIERRKLDGEKSSYTERRCNYVVKS
ncbi:Hypothetical protein PHPALM_3154 [Phytophthora palmivora]|uniref:Uncharacterized protein n=1 Tax=Phytophthora palmivora TaxID=4796 RepID=A0A2P4YN40_9STRA|nr:Hypothetical protein PHPALM_3154 [Phytophthora palmivora]